MHSFVKCSRTMVRRKILSVLLNALYFQNVLCQLQIPLGSGCSCQPLPIQQSVPGALQVANNCGCRNGLLTNLPNGIQINNNVQVAKNLPCGYATNNLQLGNLQNLLAVGNGLQLANGLPLTSPQELLALLGKVPMSNCQNMLQVSLQALLNQLNQQPNCQCGCQSLAQNVGNGIINANLLGINGIPKAISNLQVVTGQQELILGNNPCPCQNCQNIVANPCQCQAVQNIVNNPCSCQPCQNIVNNISPCQSCQNIISNPCQYQSQNVISNPCQCQSCQSPVQYTIYQ